VTLREGRYVIPVRREGKGEVGGIVHDESHTGATLFVEPPRARGLRNERKELEIISAYLPRQLSEQEIEEVISGIIADTGASTLNDLGKVMGVAMKQLKGKADGKIVQQMVRQKLS